MYEISFMRDFKENNVFFYKISIVYNSRYVFELYNEKLYLKYF